MSEAAPHNPSAPDADLSVVIVNYNVRAFLEQALRSVFRAAGDLTMEVIVVDNDSVDGSVDMVREQFPEVELISNRSNIGFGAANNQGIEIATGRYILILNPDTVVSEDALTSMVSFMDARPEAGACGCRILNPDGTFARESRRAFPTPEVAMFRLTGLSRLFPKSPRFGRYNMSYVPQDQVTEVDALSGSCMLVRHAALIGERGAGLFDTDFFMYGEDLDLCYRIQRAGWRIFYTPDAEIIHYKGESTKKGELRYVKLFYGAMVLFSEKHLHSRYSSVFTTVLRAAIVGRAFLSLCTRFARRAAWPLLDFVLVYSVVALLGLLRSASAGTDMAPLFFAAVATSFAAGAVFGIAAAGGYARDHRPRLRAVVVGVPIGFLLVATASFFAPAIAFSRLVVLAALPISWAVLALARQFNRDAGERSALLVGGAAEALRLQHLVDAHPKPPFRLIGRMGDGDEAPRDTEISGTGRPAEPSGSPAGAGTVRMLGTLRQLRDAVRIHGVDDVIFASGSLPNETIIGLMQRLNDLPVQFRTLAEGRSHVIGKAQVAQLDLPASISAAPAIRSRAAKRAFELAAAVLLLLLYPALRLGKRVRSGGAARLFRVFAGRMALVGFAENHASLIDPDWRLKSGLFNITALIQAAESSDESLARAYGYYATHQSAALDLEIIVRSLSAR